VILLDQSWHDPFVKDREARQITIAVRCRESKPARPAPIKKESTTCVEDGRSGNVKGRFQVQNRPDQVASAPSASAAANCCGRKAADVHG
jgi:hypothetical protein